VNRLSVYSLFPRVYRRLAASSGRPLYLTFDDGPNPEVTPRVLDELDRHGARGTFFVVGERAMENMRLLQEIVARGHDLGNHSFSHHKFDALPFAAQIAEVERTDDVLREVSGIDRNPFRPPHGRTSARLLMALALRRYPTVFWSIDSKDYVHDPRASIEHLAGASVAAGDVILLHDDHITALDVLRDRLPVWSAGGHSYATVASGLGSGTSREVRAATVPR
jgi:peptidoglycan/xylan/chitin deacetylase (PgdA/CDA1 family)